MRWIGALALFAVATPAAAQLRVVPEQPADAEAARAGVDIFLINDGEHPLPAEAPDRMSVTAADGTRMELRRQSRLDGTIAPGAFARLHYEAVPAVATAPSAPRQMAADADAGEQAVASSKGRASGFFDRFEPNEPIYGVFGTGDSGAKLQFSFAFRPFEDAGALDGLRFGYTQTMFWAIDEPSSPFRATIYSPEVYYERDLGADWIGAVGYRHDSNGRSEPVSRDSNRLFVRAARYWDLGRGWHAALAPEAWIYVGELSARDHIGRYWGNIALRAAIEQDAGLKIALYGRGNPDSGKGATELFLSYPLADVGGDFGISLFAEGFSGYGESLDDLERSDTHARIGIALTR
ncbi:phospholipase A [Stakelama saccharophila]|uniref:Phospholipase A1 n=1 Tax=Stakelama saccharophila TaxID=3075605 RepID=A0ABZ0BA49_9SPHN|nr:phospholipase A [Stakelama sp. W311]WNO54132.1 phospholipase A [Stakelama sp. W311]